MLKLKLQYFGHLMWRTDSLQKTLMFGKIEGRRRRGRQRRDGWMASLTRWTWVWASSRSWRWTGNLACCSLLQSDRAEQLNCTANTAPQVVLVVKNLPANAGDIRDAGSIPWLGRSPGEWHGNPLQYSCLENPLDKEPGGLQSHRVLMS